MSTQAEDRAALNKWDEYIKGLQRATVVNTSEKAEDKLNRIADLEREGNDEEWFRYYFPNYYYSEPMPFHKESTKLVMSNPEYYLVRAWSRELAKSARTMMEVIKLALTGKKRSVILASNSEKDAVRLLKPYKLNFENNLRIINDYGIQQSYGEWKEDAFTIKKGCSFIGVGYGNTPRGARNEEVRPDVVLMDDFDTDQDCRNSEIVDAKWLWFEQALYGTRSISNPMLVIFCGNIIAEHCCISKAIKMADRAEVINIRDKYGKSTWPNKNTEELIDRVLSKISYESQQKEYYNNPISKGKTFTNVSYTKAPPLRSCKIVLVYADPATSNKDKGQSDASTKCVVVIGLKDFTYYIYKVWLDQVNNSTFVEWLFEAESYLLTNKVDPIRIFIENNTLQDPFYQQVIIPLIRQKAKERKRESLPPVIPDGRKKPEKFERIEGTLEPIDRVGNIQFDEKLKGSPFMEIMETQWKGVSRTAKKMDGPDTIEGGVYIIKTKTAPGDTAKTETHTRKTASKKY